MANVNLKSVLREIKQHAGPLVAPSPLDPALLIQSVRGIRASHRARKRRTWVTVNQFCATGQGGGIDPTCSPGGPKETVTGTGATVDAGSKVSPKRTKQVLDDAAKIEVDDELVHSVDTVDVDDLEQIELSLTREEKRELESYVESAQESYVDSMTEDFEPEEFNESRWAREEGYDPNTIRKDALKRLQDWSDEDGVSRLTDAINEWHTRTDATGVEALDELRDVLEENDAPQFLKDEFDEKYSEAENRHQEAMDDFPSVEDQESEARSQAADGFDATDAQEEFLKQFVRDHRTDPRYSEGEKTYDVWGKDTDESGDHSLYFQTSKGADYQVWDRSQKVKGTELQWRELGFNDESGEYKVTGAGNAVEVFSKASASVVSLLKDKQYPVASFTAAEPSRQRLYDRLVKTVSAVLPGYSAFAHVKEGEPKRYIVVKKEKENELRALFVGQGGRMEILTNAKGSSGLVKLAPELREEWFTESGWSSIVGNAKAPTGRGQFSSQRNPWRVTIRRLAPYLLDMMPDLSKGQAEGIARSIQMGLRSNAPDSEVAAMIEQYDIDEQRAILIARTEMARARADTELGRLKPNERVVYVLADDACPKCVKVHRKLKSRKLTAKQAEGIIPVHPNCILPGNDVECADLVAATKSFYNGRAVKITLLGGRSLTVTENHPILTPDGFIAAKYLRKGNQVVHATNPQRITEAINPDYHAGPSAIEKVFESLSVAGGVSSSRMPISPEDFHGDARFFDGNVDVVHADGLLGRYSESFFSQRVNDELLGRIGTPATLNSNSALCEVCGSSLATANSVVSGSGQRLAVLGSSLRKSHDRTSGTASDLHTHSRQAQSESLPRHTDGSRYFVERFAGLISPADIVEVESFGYRGHVYDLQADVMELYICNGVIVKNCYCRWKVVNRKSGREIVRNDANGFEEVRGDVLEYSRLADNVFCSTGPGGGIDPSCSPTSVSESSALNPYADAIRQIVADSPMPRTEPKPLPPGTSNPNLRAQHPEWTPLIEEHRAHNRAMRKYRITQSLQGLTRPVPEHPVSTGTALDRKRQFLRAVGDLESARNAKSFLDTTTALDHPDGPAILKAAQSEASARYDRLTGQARKHLAALDPSDVEKGRRRLESILS